MVVDKFVQFLTKKTPVLGIMSMGACNKSMTGISQIADQYGLVMP